jgi:putative acetyltransferase
VTVTTLATVGIRAEAAADAASIRSLLEHAFGGSGEADLVEHLRTAGDLVLALVAEHESRIAGYIAFCRLTVVREARPAPATGLAPLAVAAELQRCGVGAALVRAGLSRLRDQGESLVFVLGDASYYRRFGFEVAGRAFRSPYGGPYFMLARLRGGAPASGTVRYPTAFAELN